MVYLLSLTDSFKLSTPYTRDDEDDGYFEFFGLSTTSERSTSLSSRFQGPILPVELVSMILSNLDPKKEKGSLARMLRTSKQNYELVAPILYEDVRISRKNASSFFRGLADVRPNPYHHAMTQRIKRDPGPSPPSSPLSTLSYTNPAPDDMDVGPPILLWPEADAISAPESESDDTDPMSFRHLAYPDTESQRRKRELLRHVGVLQIETSPKHQVLRQLSDWSGGTETRLASSSQRCIRSPC